MMLGLCKNGVKGHLISLYCFRFHLFYSTAPSNAATSSNLLVNFLVDSVGFSKKKAISASTKVTSCLKPGNNNPSLVLDFFKQIGLKKPQIKSLVYSNPKLLFANVDKTLKPKIELFQEFGLFGSDLARVVTGGGDLFWRSLDNTLKKFKLLQELGLSGPDLVKVITKGGLLIHSSVGTYIRNVDYLRKFLGSDDFVAQAIKRTPLLCSWNLPKVMSPNVLLLQRLGFSSLDIKKFFLNRPQGMVQKPEWLEDVVCRVENDFYISRGSPMFKHGVTAIQSSKSSTLKMKQEIFRSFGWSDFDILTMVQKLPYCLATSEAKLKKGLKFYMHEVGYDSSSIACHPTLLMFSLEKRVFPRYEIFKLLIEKRLIGRKHCLYTVLSWHESKFLENYVLPFRSEVPELYDLYMKSKGQQKKIG